MRRKGAALAVFLLGLSGAPAPGAAGEASPRVETDRGARAFQKCYACHSVRPDETGLPGPNLAGIVGRRAASQPGFDYSPALLAAARERGLVWTAETLDAFLRDPEAFVPGTSMTLIGLTDARERADLIDYLARSTP